MLCDDRRQGQDSASEYSASCIDIALARTAGCSPGAVPQPAANRPARAPSGPVMRPARGSPGCWPAPGPQDFTQAGIAAHAARLRAVAGHELLPVPPVPVLPGGGAGRVLPAPPCRPRRRPGCPRRRRGRRRATRRGRVRKAREQISTDVRPGPPGGPARQARPPGQLPRRRPHRIRHRCTRGLDHHKSASTPVTASSASLPVHAGTTARPAAEPVLPRPPARRRPPLIHSARTRRAVAAAR